FIVIPFPTARGRRRAKRWRRFLPGGCHRNRRRCDLSASNRQPRRRKDLVALWALDPCSNWRRLKDLQRGVTMGTNEVRRHGALPVESAGCAGTWGAARRRRFQNSALG